MRDRPQHKDTSSSQPKSTFFRDTVEKLRGETRLLKQQIDADHNSIKVINSESQIARLQHQEEAFSKKIDAERERKQQLEVRIKELQELIAAKRREKAIEKHDCTVDSTLIQIKQVENKIDKALQKYNDVKTRNKELQQEIDTLRKEKLVSLSIKQGLEEEFAHRDSALRILLAQNKSLAKERDEAKDSLDTLKTEAEQEREQFKRDWQQLNYVIENEKKTGELTRTTELRAVQIEAPSEHSLLESKTLNELKDFTHTVKREKKNVRSSVEKVKRYRQIFKEIEEATDIREMTQLAQKFVDIENQNYSRYNYVNELDNEIERLRKQIAEIEQEKLQFAAMQQTTQTHKFAQQQEVALSKAQARAVHYEQEYSRIMQEVNGLKLGIEQILDKIGCNNPTTEEMVRTEGVTEANMMQCLAIIELRTNEILQMYRWCQNGEPEANSQPSNRKRTKPEHKRQELDAAVCPEPDVEHHARVLSVDEMRDWAQVELLKAKK